MAANAAIFQMSHKQTFGTYVSEELASSGSMDT